MSKQEHPTMEDEEKLESAIKLVEQMESQVDILTLNKAIAIILERRAKLETAWKKWLSGRLQDIEEMNQKNQIHPLVPDFS